MRKIQIQTESDDVEIYVFIAHNKGELPSIHFGHLKVTVPLDNIQNVSVAVNLLKEGMDESDIPINPYMRSILVLMQL